MNERIGLLELGLFLFNELEQLVKGLYDFEYKKRWSQIVTRDDAFVLVLRAFDHGCNELARLTRTLRELRQPQAT